VCPEEIVEAPETPVESLARAIRYAAAQDGEISAPLVDTLLLRETRNLAGCVSEVEVRTGNGYLSLGSGIQSTFVRMLAVAEAVALQSDEERETAEADNRRIALANAAEHAREIRAALKLPVFAKGQVWRTVSGREFTVTCVLADVTVEATFSDGEVASFLQDGIYCDLSLDPQPHTILHNLPIAFLSGPAPAPTAPNPSTKE
jgi:hypothetical protein